MFIDLKLTSVVVQSRLTINGKLKRTT